MTTTETTTTTTTAKTTSSTSKTTAKTTSGTTASSIPNSNVIGDINQDGKTGVGDAVMICRIIAEDADVTVPENSNLDIDGDGMINLQDAIRVLQLLRPNNITVSKTSAQKGDTVTVEITFYGYHPSAAGAVYLEYDPLLTPTAIRWNEDLEGYHVQSETEGYPAYFSWTTKSGKNQMIPNGTVLAYVDFEVSEFITSNSVLKITPQSSMLSDENGNEIKLNAGAGFIAVVSD